MKKIDKVDSGYDYKPTAKHSVPLCDESTGYKTIYVTPAFAKLYQREKDREWQAFRRSKRCLIDSKHFGKVVCRGNCSECEHARQSRNVSLSGFVDEDGDEFEPHTGAWKDLHEESDVRNQINQEERELHIRNTMQSLIGDIGYQIMLSVYVDKETIDAVSTRHGMSYRTLQRYLKKWTDIIIKNKERFF